MASDVLINVRVQWWVHPYLQTLAAFCVLFGTQPNINRIAKFIYDHGVEVLIGD